MQAVARVRQILEPLGFDCVVPFSVRAMEAELARLGSPFDFGLKGPRRTSPLESSPLVMDTSAVLPLDGPTVPAPEPGDVDALGLLVANSRALWAPFEREFARFGAQADPLDAYTEWCFAEAEREWPGVRSFFSHGAVRPRLPVQKIADLSGGLPLGPAHLNLHPLYGPWIALRGVLVVPSEPPPPASDPAKSPCLGCSAPCRTALTEALADHPTEPWPEFAHLSLTRGGLSARAQAFLRVRGVCPVGREHRYSDEQIFYHYRRAFPS